MSARRLALLIAALVAVLLVAGVASTHSATPKPHVVATTAFGKKQAEAHKAAISKPPIVPFIRILHKGMKGCPCPTVFQMQRAIKRAGFRPKNQKSTGFFGAILARQVGAFQKANKIKPSGIYGPVTHRAMSKWYDQAGRARLQAVAHARKIASITQGIKNVTTHAWRLRSSMRYSQSASRGILPRYPGVPTATDCSGYVTWVYKSVGRPDPNGFNFSPVGYTGTLAAHGIKISAAGALHVGDLVFYGGGFPYGHVAIVVDAIKRLVSSHGSPGIKVVPFNYRPVSAIRRYF